MPVLSLPCCGPLAHIMMLAWAAWRRRYNQSGATGWITNVTITNSVFHENPGYPNWPHPSGSGIVLAGVKGGLIQVQYLGCIWSHRRGGLCVWRVGVGVGTRLGIAACGARE